MKNNSELKKLELDKLYEEQDALVKEHFKMRMQYATEQFNQTHKFKLIKKQIARVKTYINQRQSDVRK